jgi:YVTN family beta-propeller protein
LWVSAGQGVPVGTVTMLFTDIEGSTRLVKLLGERYGDLLADHRRLIRAACAAHGGHEMDTQGDAFFLAFAKAHDAVDAAIAAQRALVAHEWPDGAECRVRMGLHTGEPAVRDEGYHGMGLHRGARIAAVAHGGQIVLSSTTADLVRDELETGLSLRDLGNQRLKDIDRPERIYQLVADGLPSKFPPLRTGPTRTRRRAIGMVAAAAVVALAVIAAVFLVTLGGSGSSDVSLRSVAADSVGVIDPASGRVTGQISVGPTPSAVTTCAGSVWAANVNDHSVSRIDPVKQTTIQTIQVGNDPVGIACGGGFVWVSNGLDATVSQIDPKADTAPVNTIPVGNGPAGIAADTRYVWVANSTDGTVTRINVQTGEPMPAIPVGQSADAIALGDGSAWVTSDVRGTVTRIDERSGRQGAPINAGDSAAAIAVGAGAVWVANGLGNTLTRIDPAINQSVGQIRVGDGPGTVAIADNSVWVSNQLAGTISKVDPATNTVVHTTTTGDRPAGMTIDSGSLYVAVAGAGRQGGTIRVVDSGGRTGLTTVDPALAYSFNEWEVVTQTNDGLTGFRRVGGSAGTRLVPDLAVSLPTPTDGGRIYTFQLRRRIRYSTHGFVTPSDIRSGLERSFEVAGASYYANYYRVIVGAARCLARPGKPCDLSKGIVTDDKDHSITFHLTTPDPDFLNVLALPEAFAVPTGTPPRGFVPATGPYEVASFHAGHDVRLVRNPKFHQWSQAAQPSGYPSSIAITVTGTNAAHIGAVVAGTADLATELNGRGPAVARVRTQHASLVKVNPRPNTWFIALNTQRPPFKNLQARRAVNLALNRLRLLDYAFGKGFGRVTCQVLPTNLAGYRPYCPYTAHPGRAARTWTSPDFARAQHLVRVSGTAGQSVTVWLPSFLEIPTAAASYVVHVLDRLHYHAHYRLSNRNPPSSAQSSFNAWYPDYPTPSGVIEPTLTCGQLANISQFCQPGIDTQVARAERLENNNRPQAAYVLWATIDHEITNRAPWVSYAIGDEFELAAAGVGNYQLNPQWGPLLDQMWLR